MLNELITVMALIVATAQFIFIFNLGWSLRHGRVASPNPWRAASLEWQTPQTPPVHGNWGEHMPVVYRWAYAYGANGGPDDFIAQNAPPEAGGIEPDHRGHAGQEVPV